MADIQEVAFGLSMLEPIRSIGVPELINRPPRRDWRDWFIMATVSSGVSYGLYIFAKVLDGCSTISLSLG